MWDCITEIMEAHNAKVVKLRSLLNGKKQELHGEGVLVLEVLESITKIQ